MSKKKALFVTNQFERIYSPEDQASIRELVDVVAPPQRKDVAETNPGVLAEVEIILSGWGGPRLDEAFLEKAPRLEAFFYGAGTVRDCVTDAAWDRGLTITSSWAANAIPVAEFAVARILLGLKRADAFERLYRDKKLKERPEDVSWTPGCWAGTVGLIGLGMIGRLVAGHLRHFGVRLLASDPTVTAEQAAAFGAESADLGALFRDADVVSLHAPLLDSTRGTIGREHFEAMKPWATFVNTARGAIVREDEMIEVLRRRPDLTAALDVTSPEPPPADSPLWTLENVILTPHIAGSLGPECHRMGRYALEDLRRYLAGEPLRWRLTREQARLMA